MSVATDSALALEAAREGGVGRVFIARDKFRLPAGDAGALLLELNGRTLALMGPPGHEGEATLTRESLKGTTGGGH